MRPVGRRTGVIVAAAVVVVVTALALSGSGRATAGRQTYLQFNLCGNACNNGGLGVITALESSIRERGPSAVTLNEVCENQYATLRANLTDYEGRFDPTGPRCRNGARYGNAVLVRATNVDLVGSWELPNPAGDETRRLMCLRTDLVVCVTHISNESGNIAAQVEAVAGIVNTLDANNAVLLGGDFNTNPADTRMDPLYRTCAGAGRFHEADAAGCASRSVIDVTVGSDVINENTYGPHKYDYIFLSDGDWSSSTADAIETTNGLSDHDALWATTKSEESQ